MDTFISLVLFSLSVRGNVGFSILPQAVTDSTREFATSPRAQLRILDIVPGISLEGSWRGLWNDHTRADRAASRILFANLSYKTKNSPVSIKLGRQFAYLYYGGLIDGVSGTVTLSGWQFKLLYGRTAPDVFLSQEAFWDSSANTLLGVLLSTPVLFKRAVIKAGYAQKKSGDSLTTPIWASVDYYWKTNIRIEAAYDPKDTRLERFSVIGYGRLMRTTWLIGMRYRDLTDLLTSWGTEESEEEEEEGGEERITRIEASMRYFWNPLLVSLGTWFAVGGETYNTYWIRAKYLWISYFGWLGKEPQGWQKGSTLSFSYPLNPQIKVYISGRLIDEPRTPNVWVESLRTGLRLLLPYNATLKAEFRIWQNPEVDMEVQGFFNLSIPFNWRV